MSGFTTAIQQAIYSALSGDVGLTALVTAVYDDVPQFSDTGDGANFPYVTIGEDSLNNWDTDTELGTDASITVHTWSRYKGRKEVKQIQSVIYSALHRADLTVSGYNFIGLDWTDSTSFLDTDGFTRHGVCTYRMLLQTEGG